MRVLLWVLTLAGCGPWEPAGPPEGPCLPPPPPTEALRVAGSGTNLPLARWMAGVYERRHSEAIAVAASIGTSGAVAALRDGAIDVGLASRPLKPEEREAGIVAVPWVRVEHGVVVHQDSPVTETTLADLVALVRGDPVRWPGASPPLVVLREPGDSGNRVLSAQLPALGRAIDVALAAARWPVRYTDGDMATALQELPGALGFLDAGTTRVEHLPLRLLRVEVGLDRPPARVLKPLSLLLPPRPGAAAQRFVELCTSFPRELLLARGYLPPEGGP